MNVQMGRLLLGSAASIFVISGAQAADVPVKAPPLITSACSHYGPGFYVIPGTNFCVNVAGYVRAEFDHNASTNSNSGGTVPFINIPFGRNTSADTPDYVARFRGAAALDVRTETAWGTARGYVRARGEMVHEEPNTRWVGYVDRAFVQFAGFTVGRTRSAFDFYANALSYTTLAVAGSDTDFGINLASYTIKYAGFSATISVEDSKHRRTGIWDFVEQCAALRFVRGAEL